MHPAPAGLVRLPGREPKYFGRPTYCALAFSPQARGCVWLARDERHLYVDRHAQGDLRGASQQVELRPQRLGTPIDAGDLYPEGVDGPVRLKLHQFLIGGELTIYLHVWFADGRREGSSPIWLPEPKSAPRISFYGPLTFIPSSASSVLSRGGPAKLEVELGRPGVGERSFAWRNHSDVPRDLHPLAEIRLLSAHAEPTIVTYRLDQRCCGCRFFRYLDVTDRISHARVVVSFDDWPAGGVEPVRFMVACE